MEIINEIKKREEEIDKINSMLKEIILPKSYEFDVYRSGASICKKYRFFGFLPSITEVAKIYLRDEKLVICFDEMEYFTELRDALEISPISDKLTVKINPKEEYY